MKQPREFTPSQYIRFLLLIGTVFFLVGCEDSAPIEISTGIDMHTKDFQQMIDLGITDPTYSFVDITATVDKVAITGYSLNRGNCGAKQKIFFPLKYGQNFRIKNLQCNLREIEVNTNKGTYTFSVD